MRKFLVCVTFGAMVIVLAAGSARTYRSYATATGKPCSYCHIDPNGGGPRTPAGEYYFNYGTLPPAVPAAPTGLAATVVSSSQINLSWTDASTDETGFKLERSAFATGPWTGIATPAANATTYSNTGLTASTTYYYRVCATNTAGDSAYSNVVSAATLAPPPVIPAAPTGLAATAVSSSQIDLQWTDASSNETGFKLERSAFATGPWAGIATPAANATTYSNTGLTASTTYYYRVCATNTAGDSAYSNVASAATLAPPPVIPAAPTGLSATAISYSQIDLQWTDASSNETGFKLERSAFATGPWTGIATPAANATTYSNTGLTPSMTYYYRVCATNTAGDSAYSNIVSAVTLAVPPAAPTGLSATAISSSQIDLQWTDASSNETGFKLERSALATGPWAGIATPAANATTYSNTGLTASTTFYYRVCATNTAGDSAYSNIVSAVTLAVPPAAPTGLTATAISSSQIDLQWTDASSDETGFKLERSAFATGPWAGIATPAANATTYSNTGLTASTTYYYRVCATNTAGDSAYSNVVSAVTLAVPPAAPTGLAATAISSSQIDLQWTDASSNETGFKLERSALATGPWTGIATPAANATTYSNTGLTASTTFYYRVCATNTAGDSAYSNIVSAVTLAVPPAAPTGLSATAISSSQIDLQWTDASSNETGFKLERSALATGPWAGIATPAANATTYSSTGLTASTTYYYRVCATNTAGDSAYSNIVSAVTLAVPPAAPTGLAATVISSSQINLSWTDASSNETGFKLERSAFAAGPWAGIATPAANATTYSNTGLTASTTYFYRVCATNTAGDSAYSNTVSAATLAPAPVIPAAPTGLSATAISSSQIDLQWTDASSNETGFKLERSAFAAGPWTGIATPAANATTYSNTGLTASTTYYYRVCATNTAGDSAYSNVVSADTPAATGVPTAPTDLVASPGSSKQIDLQWSDESSDETGFDIERSAAATGPFVVVATVAAGVTAYSDTGLTSSTTFYYRVCATNAAGDSDYSNVASAATLARAVRKPRAPINFSATAVSPEEIALEWLDLSNNETGFKVERSLSRSGPFAVIADLAAGATTYLDTGLAGSTRYYYRVCAYNEVGSSRYSGLASATTWTAVRGGRYGHGVDHEGGDDSD